MCSRCGRNKPLLEFHIDRSRRDGRAYVCRECFNSRKREQLEDPKRREACRARSRDYQRRWRAANPELRKDRELRSLYGISLTEYEALAEKQGFACAICGAAELVVDHLSCDGIGAWTALPQLQQSSGRI